MVARTNAMSEQTFDATYECAACGFTAEAAVTAKGHGTAGGWHDAAADEASQKAYQDAVSVAQRTLWFVPCPKCGATGAGNYKLVTFAGTLGIGAGTGVLCAVLFGRGDLLVQLIVGGFAAVAFGGIFFWKRARVWFGAAERVRISPP